MWQVITEHYHDDRPIPLTMCFGVPPAATLIAGSGFDYVILPMGADELGAAGAVQGFPLRIVRARTVDAWALADCDLVLEGYLHPRDKRFETAEAEAAGVQGKYPFHPEWAGYMGKAYRAPTFHVTAITRRRSRKPIFYVLGVHTLDDNNIDTTVREAAIFELCERLQPGLIQDVHIPYCMTDWGGCILQVKKRNRLDDGFVRNFLVATMATSFGMRLAIAVDSDVDIYCMDEILWALTTRVNPRSDLLTPVPGGAGQTFVPAERLTAGEQAWTAMNIRFEGGLAIDATVPYGYEKDFQRPVYPVHRVDLRRFFSDEQIARGRSVMRGWVELLSRTGR
jgi:4-hydroxy-3-polyprenylbenzoate decarboxylase